MNEIKTQTASPSIIGIIALFLLIVSVCAGLVYYYRGADKQLESELADVERLNQELASETRQLQAGIASHSAGIGAVRGKISKSRKRIERVYTDLEEAGNDAERAIKIIEECESIIQAVKAQKSH